MTHKLMTDWDWDDDRRGISINSNVKSEWAAYVWSGRSQWAGGVWVRWIESEERVILPPTPCDDGQSDYNTGAMVFSHFQQQQNGNSITDVKQPQKEPEQHRAQNNGNWTRSPNIGTKHTEWK